MGFIRQLTGKDAAKAAVRAGEIQADAAQAGIEETRLAKEDALAFLNPFRELGQTGIDQASFLTDPGQQFAFLQDNPLFDFALNNANRETQNLAAARGRLSAGDTLQQLTNNAFTQASPLIAGQKSSILDLLNFGQNANVASANASIGAGTGISELLASQGAAQASGKVGAANAKQNAAGNLTSLVAGAALTPFGIPPTSLAGRLF